MNTSALDYNKIIVSEEREEDDKLPNNAKSLFSRLKKVTSISEVLRLFGACAVIASMSLFLLNGWSDDNDIQRYLKLLGQTGLLTVAGLLLSFVLKENKGARIFFGLSLMSVVANFMVLGALTYSMFQLDGSLIEYPSIATWKAVSVSAFWPIFAIAVTLLTILTRFSFSIFARNIAAPLSVNFLLMCSLLLIPVRSSIIVSLLAVTALWFSGLVIKKLSRNEKITLTKETKFALGLMLAPGLLIIARALSLYNVDEVMLITLSGLSYFALHSWIVRLAKQSLMQKIIEKVQFVIAIYFSSQLVSLLPSESTISLSIFSVIVIALTYHQITASNNTKWHKSIITMTTIILVAINTLIAYSESNIVVQTGSLLICVGLLWFANFMQTEPGENNHNKLIALIGIMASTLMLMSEVIAHIQLGNWIVIGLIGGALIVSGSLFERYGMSLFTLSKKVE